MLLYSTKVFKRRRPPGRCSTTRSTRARSRSRTTRSRSPTPRSTFEGEAVARDHRPLRADPDPVQRDGGPAQAAAPADQEVLGPRIRRDLLFENGEVVAGAAWPYQTNTLQAAKAPVADTSRARARRAGPTPGCSPPRPRTRTAPTSGCRRCPRPRCRPKRRSTSARRRPTQACPIMNKLQKGACAAYHANAPRRTSRPSSSGRRRVAHATTAKNDCVDFTQWQQAWTQITGGACGRRHAYRRARACGGPASASRPRCGAARGCGRSPAVAAAGLVPRRLPRVAGRHARHGVLDGRLADRQHRLPVDLVELRPDLHHSVRLRPDLLRTVIIAAAVTVTDAVIALPFAFFLARVARAGGATLLFVLVLLPLWASYLAGLRLDQHPLQQRRPHWALQRLGLPDRLALHERGDVDRVLVPVAALHDRARLRRVRAGARLVPRGVGGPRRGRLWTFRTSSCPWCCPGSSPARSSPSRSPSVTTSRRCSSAGRARIHRQRRLRNSALNGEPAVRRGARVRVDHHGHLPPAGAAGSAPSRRCDGTRSTRAALVVSMCS